MSRRFRAALLLTTALLAAACGGGEEEAEPVPTASASQRATPTPTPSETEEGPRHPLAGTPARRVEDLTRPVLAAKIENSSASRPQTGLELADVVYEELVEGGVTRFIVLFQSQVPDEFGPVRSARLADVDVLPAYDPIFAISGARDEVLNALAGAGVATLADGVGFYRDRTHGRRAPHNLYASGPDLYERGSTRSTVGPPPTDWEFDDEAPAGAVDCDDDPLCEDAGRSFSIRMSTIYSTGWEYDEAEGVYRRLQNGQPFEVTGDGEVGAANVLVLGMAVGPGGCCDSAGAPLVKTQVLGTGRGILLRDGQWYEVTWSKRTQESPLALTLADRRQQIALKPGPTWIMLAPVENMPDAPA